tara:strand:+ start:472 stop:663 length:192 start_codon:yes stop_codon:yes gene_type:complete
MSVSINKEKFDKFEAVVRSGKYNMYDRTARYETDLTKKEWEIIIKDYVKLKDAWSTNNNNGVK